jgi:hypothetical protein
VVFLEYNVDSTLGNRQARWWTARGTGGTVYLPLAMLESGHIYSSGSLDYAAVYRGYVNTELSRPPGATVEAYARRVGSALRVYATITNMGTEALSSANDATVNVLVWEEARVALTNRYVRAAPSMAVPGTVPPGGSAMVVLNATLPSGVNWSKIHAVVALDYRPGENIGRYDMPQAAAAAAPALSAVPAELSLRAFGGTADARGSITLRGPHVLRWTATSDEPWLSVTPAEGGLPAEIEVSADAGRLEPGSHEGRLVFSGVSDDGLSLSCEVVVSVERLASGRPLRVRIQGAP